MTDSSLEAQPATTLVKDAIDESRELLRAEMKLASQDLQTEVKEATGAVGAFTTALFAALLGCASLFTALLIALGTSLGWSLFIVGCSMLFVAVVALAIGAEVLPRRLLGRTRDRVRHDVAHLQNRST